MRIGRYIPIVDKLKQYTVADLKSDFFAGLTLGVLLIPQGMAYAVLAGLPPVYGLYASVIPVFIYAIFGTSPSLSVGPAALLSLLILAGISPIAQPGSVEYISLAIQLAFLVGVIRLLLGLFKMGFMVNFISNPVISGFTSAAAIIIAVSQFKNLLGIKLQSGGGVVEVFMALFAHVHEIHLPTVIFGVSAILLMFFFKILHKSIPGPLITMILGTVVMYLFHAYETGISITGRVPVGWPEFKLPVFELASMRQLIPVAFTIALIGFMESVAVSRAIQSKRKTYKVNPNQELLALGLSGIVGSFFQAFPTTGSFSRTVINHDAGARSTLSAVFGSILVLITLLFLTPLFYYLPATVLSAIIIMAVKNLIDLKEPLRLWHADRRDFYMLMVTFIVTLGFGIITGLVTGVLVSITMMVFRTSYPHYAVLGRLEGTTYFRNVLRFKKALQRPDMLVIRYDSQLYFGNANYFRDTILRHVHMKGKELKIFVLNAEAINAIDSTGLEVLAELHEELRARDIMFYLSGVKGPVRDVLARNGLMEKIGKENFFIHTVEAVEKFEEQVDDISKKTIHS
ncbi:MAG: SulP family inorganic anion transporter [Cyclobacteriaceae bacterium]